MGLSKLISTHFNPNETTKQVKDDSPQSYILGALGFTIVATAGIGYQFFGASGRTAGMLAAGGAGFLASYFTEKDGYAWLVGLAATGGIAIATIDAINKGRFFVTLNIDIGDIIRAVRENTNQAHY